MRGRRSTTVERPPAPVGAGTSVADFRVERVLHERAGRSTVADATAPDGHAVSLIVFPSAGADGKVRERVAGFASLHEVEDAPLVPPDGAGEADGRLYVARPKPGGETLADMLRDKQGPLEPREALRLLSEVAGGLETLTRFGLPHGCLTPEAIRVRTRRVTHAALCDYGFASPPGKACKWSSMIERVDYLAPEALRGAPTEPASTIYSLACILVECLTGAPPFPYDRPVLVVHAHLSEPPPRVSERRKLPAELDAVLQTALSKFPEQRQQTPAAFMRAVQRAFGVSLPIPVAERPVVAEDPAAPTVEAKPTPRAELPPARARRRRPLIPWPAPAGVVLTVAFLASTGGFATGNLRGTADGSAAADRPAARAALAQHAAYVRAVDQAVARLRDRRAAARHRLGAAPRAAAQATAAIALADMYRETRAALPGAPAGTAGADQLTAQLRAAGGAYRRLAAAARRGDATAFRAARADVIEREQGVERELAGLAAVS